MNVFETVLIAFATAKTLKVVRKGSSVWLSNCDGFPLNLLTGQLERIESDLDPDLYEGGSNQAISRYE
jgi:hypothetical protein